MTDFTNSLSTLGDGLMEGGLAAPLHVAPEIVQSPFFSGTKSEVAYFRLREQIMNGVLEPGTAINQESLASDMGISVTPLREALRRLQVEGMVDVLSHRAAVVAPLRASELRDLYQVRLQLDPFAASLAATEATAQERALLLELAQAPPQNSSTERLACNERFHYTLVNASGNKVLSGACRLFWARTNRYRHILLRDHSLDEEVSRDHAQIVEAINRGAADEARELTYLHTKRAQELIGKMAGFLDSSDGGADAG